MNMAIISAVVGLLMILIALPAQVLKNYREKRCGLAFLLIVASLSVYTTRSVYAAQQGAWGIVIPDVAGIVAASIIMAQWFIYRKK